MFGGSSVRASSSSMVGHVAHGDPARQAVGEMRFDVRRVPLRENHLGVLPVALVAALPIVGCGDRPPFPSAPTRPETTGAVAVVHPTEGHQARRTVSFREEADSVRITVNLTGWSRESTVSTFTSAATAARRTGHRRAGTTTLTAILMAGRIPPCGTRVIWATSPPTPRGGVTAELLDSVITLNGANSIIGRGVIVHEGPDDFTTQPTGGAGAARVAASSEIVTSDGVGAALLQQIRVGRLCAPTAPSRGGKDKCGRRPSRAGVARSRGRSL